MLAFAFLNPLLLWALPLCAVPIIIHLLNRRRFKIVPWAAMEYLLAALKRNRKRLRMEQWLVLLLRVLAVLFLVFLVSRPQLGGGGLIGSTTHHVVLLDDTASMTQRSGSTNLFEKAQDKVRELADRLALTRGGDLFSLVTSSHATEPQLWAQHVGPDFGTRVGQKLKELSVGDGTQDLGQLLQVTRKRALEQKEASRTDYYLLTDLRSYDWVTDDEKPRSKLAVELAAMQPDHESLRLVSIGAHDVANLAVVGVRRLDRIAIAGLPVALAVDVQNFGLDGTAPAEVSVEVDGKSNVVRPVLALAPGERTTVDVIHTFHTAGFHRVEAKLPASETFLLDDRRTLALEVVERARMLLVDGEPGDSGEEGETFFLSVALDTAGDSISGKTVEVVSDLALAEMDLAKFDMVWLCNVPVPTEAVVQKLEQYVGNGGGLVFYLGGQIDAARYNEHFYKGGKGLLPFALGETEGDPDRPEHGFLQGRDHPVAAAMPEIMEVLLSKALLVKRYQTMVDDGTAPARVLARVRDAEGSPLVVTRTFGSGGGEVAVLGLSADKHWSNLPDTYLGVVLNNEIFRCSTRVQDLAPTNLGTEDTYHLQLDPGRYKGDVTLRAVGEGGEETTVTALAPTPPEPAPGAAPPPPPEQPAAAAPLELDVPMPSLRALGAYEVELRTHGEEAELRMFARNPPTVDGRLVRLTRSLFQKSYPPEVQDRVQFVEEGGGFGSGEGEGEIWRLLALALLAGLLLESLLAWRFGRR